MSQNLPSFKKPPLVETAISLQFDLVEGFTNAHLGVFWQKVRGRFPKPHDAEPIENQIELFGDQVLRRPRLPGFRLVSGIAPTRLQVSSDDNQGMIQLQNGRIVYNWQRMNAATYPRWHMVLPSFLGAVAELRDLLSSEGLKDIEPNQWEVTYVNHFERGTDWSDPKDWPSLVPGLIGRFNEIKVGSVESVGCSAHLALPENAGRLHIDLHHGFAGVESEAAEVLVLQFTARGGMGGAKVTESSALFEIGHRSIVRAFCEITGADAQKRWEREP